MLIETIGWLSSLPFLAGMAGIYLITRHPDKHGQGRRWHAAIPTIISGVLLIKEAPPLSWHDPTMTFPSFYDAAPRLILRDPLSEFLGVAEGGLLHYGYADAVKPCAHLPAASPDCAPWLCVRVSMGKAGRSFAISDAN